VSCSDGEDVAHARELFPLDLGSLVEQGRIDVLDRFANLHGVHGRRRRQHLGAITFGDLLHPMAAMASFNVAQTPLDYVSSTN